LLYILILPLTTNLDTFGQIYPLSKQLLSDRHETWSVYVELVTRKMKGTIGHCTSFIHHWCLSVTSLYKNTNLLNRNGGWMDQPL